MLYSIGGGKEGIISLDDISEVRAGHGTDIFNTITKAKNGLSNFDVGSGKKLDITRNNCFSIIFKDDRRPLDLVAEDVVTRRFWVSSLCYATSNWCPDDFYTEQTIFCTKAQST